MILWRFLYFKLKRRPELRTDSGGSLNSLERFGCDPVLAMALTVGAMTMAATTSAALSSSSVRVHRNVSSVSLMQGSRVMVRVTRQSRTRCMAEVNDRCSCYSCISVCVVVVDVIRFIFCKL